MTTHARGIRSHLYLFLDVDYILLMCHMHAQVAAKHAVVEKVEEDKEEALTVVAKQEPAATIEPQQIAGEVTTSEVAVVVVEPENKEEEEAVEKTVIEKEKPSAVHVEENIATDKVAAEPTTELKKDTKEEI